jgi:hypothetical protein
MAHESSGRQAYTENMLEHGGRKDVEKGILSTGKTVPEGKAGMIIPY